LIGKHEEQNTFGDLDIDGKVVTQGIDSDDVIMWTELIWQKMKASRMCLGFRRRRRNSSQPERLSACQEFIADSQLVGQT